MSELKSFDRVAHCYDDTRGVPPEAARAIGEGMAAVLRGVRESPRALEIGVGTGRIAAPLAAAGVRVTGVDVSRKMMALLREKTADVGLVLADAAHPPFRDAVFDGLIFIHILHLVPDASAALAATLPLVRAGGVVVQGGDDRPGGRREEADRVIREAVREIAGRDIMGGDRHGDIAAFTERTLRAAGATIERATLARWVGKQQGRRMLERLRTKDYSGTWAIPDDVMPALIARVTPEIERVYGSLDGEVEVARSFSVMVARLP